MLICEVNIEHCGGPQYSVCVRVFIVYVVNICIESICMPQFEEKRERRQDAVGVHLCCCVLWLTLSNWWNGALVCVCVCT